MSTLRKWRYHKNSILIMSVFPERLPGTRSWCLWQARYPSDIWGCHTFVHKLISSSNLYRAGNQFFFACLPVAFGTSTFASATGAAAFFASLCDINLHVLLRCIKLFVDARKKSAYYGSSKNNANLFRKFVPYNPRIYPRALSCAAGTNFPAFLIRDWGVSQKREGIHTK